METTPHVAVIVPCFNEARHVEQVVRSIPPLVRTIVAVDDASVDGTWEVLGRIEDARLVRLRHDANQGVGGAVVSGYRQALAAGADVCVKMDGDGQMSAADLARLVAPVVAGTADYAKGNRFRQLRALSAMPRMRLFGNSALSFLTKLVSGYWSILDPTNGYTAVSAGTLRGIELGSLDRRYFFETSMLVELNIRGARVEDVEMPARYGAEVSKLSVGRAAFGFTPLLVRSLMRRFFWRYLIQDFNALTVCVLAGVPAIVFGVLFGGFHWWQSIRSGIPATAGTTILAALPILLGFQCLLTAFVLDMLYQPRAGRVASTGAASFGEDVRGGGGRSGVPPQGGLPPAGAEQADQPVTSIRL